MLKILDSTLWAVATVFIVYSGIRYTFRLKFVQFRFVTMFKNLFKKQKSEISPIESLMIVLGGRIGVGSIAGVALCICLGGYGSLFWLWVSGFLSAPNTFAESLLGVKYQETKETGLAEGGPSYYLKKALSKKYLSRLYAHLIVISQIGGFLSIQSNTITKSITPYLSIHPFIIGLLIGIISFFIIIGGIRTISKASKKLVPIMTIIYLSISLYILILHFDKIPSLLITIIKDAFNFKSFGIGVLANMVIGIQRGIFSNEAGLGTGAITSSTVKVDLPASQGFVQMLGIYITTFLVCTATAIIILTADIPINLENINGIEITQAAFHFHLGNMGDILVVLSIILFAFSTILSGYYDSEASFSYLFKPTNKKLLILKIISVIIIVVSSCASSHTIWQIVNIFTALLAIINIYALLHLEDEVISELEKYDRYNKVKYDKQKMG